MSRLEPRICEICGEHEFDEMRSVGLRLDVYECEDGLYRCDVCMDDYKPEEVDDAG